VMLMDAEDSVPQKKPALTPSGSRRFTRSARPSGAICTGDGSTRTSSRRCVRPSRSCRISLPSPFVLRREPTTPYGEHPLSAIYAGTMTRDRCDRIDWKGPAAVNAGLDAENLLIAAKGRTKSLAPIDLTQRPDLAEVVSEFEATLRHPAPALSGSVSVEAPTARSEGDA
jgi:hypothetical protein